MRKLLTGAIYGLGGLFGLVAFLYPLLSLALLPLEAGDASAGSQPSQADASLLTGLLIFTCLTALLIEIQGQAVNAKVVAALGVLVAVASVLRFLETAIPGPGGFSPIFVPIILSGFVYGARFGFLMGTMTLLVSALLTGGVGPWLPYQMFAAGWIGMSAGWLPRPKSRRIELAMLATFAFMWGLLFGFMLNLYFWPFLAADAATSWGPGSGLGTAIAQYATFYLATSFVWDMARGLGNAVLILALGIPVVRALDRFRDRLQFELA